MTNVSKWNYRGLVMQKYGSSFEVILKDVPYITKLMVNLFLLTKSISTKGVQLSSKGQIVFNLGRIRHFLIQSFNMVLIGFPLPKHMAATAHPWTSTSPNSQVLAATVFSMVFEPRTNWNIPVLILLSAKPKSRI
jgi:hypothetical protein